MFLFFSMGAPLGSFGVYFHTPYCLQRCTYCDFATFSKDQVSQLRLPPPEEYFKTLTLELRQRAPLFRNRLISSIYFGGGTPSLVPAHFIVSLLEELEKQGVARSPDAEITLEINPATVDPHKMELYLKAGINRFSVGAQTFNDALLKSVHREHNSTQTRETLSLLKSYGVNFSFDLLFALPGQSLDILNSDLDEVIQIEPNHVSPYCLTVPEGHVLSAGRPLENIQLEMFDLISARLRSAGFVQYEISNFSKPGFESKHNSVYWDDTEYWGLGLSSHSYEKLNRWGGRYWNSSNFGVYMEQVSSWQNKVWTTPLEHLPDSQKELLLAHQSLTDFCHTSLRTQSGLEEQNTVKKFGPKIMSQLVPILLELKERGWLKHSGQTWSLSSEGIVLSNQVFAALTFLEGEISVD